MKLDEMLDDRRVKYERKMQVQELESDMKFDKVMASANFAQDKLSQELCEVKNYI
jgi:hypothetical protein